MNLLNINVPKDRASMILDHYTGAESYSTTLYLYKSNIVFWEEGNKYSAEMEIDLNKNPKKAKMIKQTLAREYGSFLITFLNADFSNAENAYNTFFIFSFVEFFNLIVFTKSVFFLIILIKLFKIIITSFLFFCFYLLYAVVKAAVFKNKNLL